MKKAFIIIAVFIVSLFVYSIASASEDGCYTGDYQGAPIEICPEPIPDPTNCYTGDYQGAPIEICMPTGWVPDPTWTYQGKPIVMHVSKDYIPPVETAETIPMTTVVQEVSAHESSWLDELQEILVLNGRW